MNQKHIIGIVALFILLFFITTPVVEAQSASNGFERIGNFFKNQEYKENSQLIDFLIYFILFFSISWLGLGRGLNMDEQNRGAVVGISLALALIFAWGLSQKLPIAHLFVVGKVLLFVVFVILLYTLFASTIIGKDSFGKKFLSFILALIVAYFALTFLNFTICTFENPDTGACSAGPLNSAYHYAERVTGGDLSKMPFYNTQYVPSGIGGASAGLLGQDISSNQCEGGTRIDLHFAESDKRFTHKKDLLRFISKLRPGQQVYLYSFSQEEEDPALNQESAVYAVGRKEVVEKEFLKQVKKRDDLFGNNPPVLISKVMGPTSLFSDYKQAQGISVKNNENIRVILSTMPIADFVPAPAVNTLIECTGTNVFVECNDKKDNDKDGLVDLDDPDCENDRDPTEFTEGTCEELVEQARENNFNFEIELDKWQDEYNDVRDRWELILERCERQAPESRAYEQAYGHYYYYKGVWEYYVAATCEDRVASLESFEKAATVDFDLRKDTNEKIKFLEELRDSQCGEEEPQDSSAGSITSNPWFWVIIILVVILIFLLAKPFARGAGWTIGKLLRVIKDLLHGLRKRADKLVRGKAEQTVPSSTTANKNIPEEHSQESSTQYNPQQHTAHFINYILSKEEQIKNLSQIYLIKEEHQLVSEVLGFGKTLEPFDKLRERLNELLRELKPKNLEGKLQEGTLTQQDYERAEHARHLLEVIKMWLDNHKRHAENNEYLKDDIDPQNADDKARGLEAVRRSVLLELGKAANPPYREQYRDLQEGKYFPDVLRFVNRSLNLDLENTDVKPILETIKRFKPYLEEHYVNKLEEYGYITPQNAQSRRETLPHYFALVQRWVKQNKKQIKPGRFQKLTQRWKK
jgi:Sec-independent protein translocase protein TatA